ncbi:MAG: hypothetical protein ACK5B9_03230 [Flavobacteriia bacterium]
MTVLNEHQKGLIYVDLQYFTPFLLNENHSKISIKVPAFNVVNALHYYVHFLNLDIQYITKVSLYECTNQFGTTKYIFKRKQLIEGQELKDLILAYKKFHLKKVTIK